MKLNYPHRQQSTHKSWHTLTFHSASISALLTGNCEVIKGGKTRKEKNYRTSGREFHSYDTSFSIFPSTSSAIESTLPHFVQ